VKQEPTLATPQGISQRGFYGLTCEPTRRPRALRVALLRRYAIELPRRFLIKQGAFRLVTAAPMLVATRNP